MEEFVFIWICARGPSWCKNDKLVRPFFYGQIEHLKCIFPVVSYLEWATGLIFLNARLETYSLRDFIRVSYKHFWSLTRTIMSILSSICFTIIEEKGATGRSSIAIPSGSQKQQDQMLNHLKNLVNVGKATHFYKAIIYAPLYGLSSSRLITRITPSLYPVLTFVPWQSISVSPFKCILFN